MMRERFLAVTDFIKCGTIEIVSRSELGVVEVRLPKTLWLQLTGEDLVRGAQGNLTKVFHRDVQAEILRESKWDVILLLKV